MSPIGFIVNLATIAVCLYTPIVIWLRYPDTEAMIILGAVTIAVLAGGRLLYHKWCKYKEKHCVENECGCVCHFIKKCKCDCHEQCDVYQETRNKELLENDLETKKNHCEECQWDLGIPGFPCECLCHPKGAIAVKQRPRNDYCSCHCHQWCHR